MMIHRVETEIGGRSLILETGRVARQADGAVWVQYGETVVLVTVVAAKTARDGIDFLPLTVDYQEKAYAAGKIPGGYFKREGRLSEKETLCSRLIDRPLRPLFPENWFFETQILASVISSDKMGVSDIMGILGASAAVTISEIPFHGPVGAVRIGRVNGALVVNPSLVDLTQSDMNIVVAGTTDAVIMVESESKEVSEPEILEAIRFAHQEIQKIVALQQTLQSKVNSIKRLVPPVEQCAVLAQRIRETYASAVQEAVQIVGKEARQARLDQLLSEGRAGKQEGETEKAISALFQDLERQAVRRMILQRGMRADGRTPSQIRPITCEVGVLPRTHGSALFTRGETQSLSVATLGTSDDAQRMDGLEGDARKPFMLHYNFPPFSTGETRPTRGPGRREIGHGALAERALKQVLPDQEAFPYTLRIVSDILESNGSSSMATVCGGTLALMDAGVPIVRPVAGIAMGLVREQDQFQVLSDILGMEDHLGDMDFKVAGTARGITALQMDLKIGGLPFNIMEEALTAARVGRLHILEIMLKTLSETRDHLSEYAPRITTLHVRKEKVREVIGPGGKVIRGIVEATGVKIDIADDGTIRIASSDNLASQKAVEMINAIVEEVEVGRVYVGKITRIMDFGAFVEIKHGVEGLVHISQLAQHRVQKVTDEVKEGEEITVKVIEVDRQGKIRLSRKEVLAAT